MLEICPWGARKTAPGVPGKLLVAGPHWMGARESYTAGGKCQGKCTLQEPTAAVELHKASPGEGVRRGSSGDWIAGLVREWAVSV